MAYSAVSDSENSQIALVDCSVSCVSFLYNNCIDCYYELFFIVVLIVVLGYNHGIYK